MESYIDGFSSWRVQDTPDLVNNPTAVFDEFQVSDKNRVGVEILLAVYETSTYQGYAFVLFRKDGKLYEVNGSHCSCYGLEGQWTPEETSIPVLKLRDMSVYYGSSFDKIFNDYILELERQQ